MVAMVDPSLVIVFEEPYPPMPEPVSTKGNRSQQIEARLTQNKPPNNGYICRDRQAQKDKCTDWHAAQKQD